MEVERVVTNAPSDSAFFGRSCTLVGLTFDAKIHDMISTDGTVIDNDVPSPESDGVPLPRVLVMSLLEKGRNGIPS